MSTKKPFNLRPDDLIGLDNESLQVMVGELCLQVIDQSTQLTAAIHIMKTMMHSFGINEFHVNKEDTITVELNSEFKIDVADCDANTSCVLRLVPKIPQSGNKIEVINATGAALPPRGAFVN